MCDDRVHARPRPRRPSRRRGGEGAEGGAMIREAISGSGIVLSGVGNSHAHVACGPVFVAADTAEEARVAAEAIADGHVACGLAFDCGMREAERDRALARAERAEGIEHDFAATPWAQAAIERVDLRDQRDALALALSESKREADAA